MVGFDIVNATFLRKPTLTVPKSINVGDIVISPSEPLPNTVTSLTNVRFSGVCNDTLFVMEPGLKIPICSVVESYILSTLNIIFELHCNCFNGVYDNSMSFIKFALISNEFGFISIEPFESSFSHLTFTTTLTGLLFITVIFFVVVMPT